VSEERLLTQVSNLPFLKLFSHIWALNFYHKPLHIREHQKASSNQDTIQAGECEELCSMSVYCLHKETKYC